MERPEFYFSIGDIETDIPYRRPTLVSVTDWWKEFKYEVGVDEFDIWLVGSFMEKTLGVYNRPPNDLDVVFTGEIKDEARLKKLLDRAMEIGFDNKVLVDAFWSSDVLFPHNVPFKPYATIRNASGYIKTIGGELIQRHYKADEIFPMSNGLFQYVWYDESPTYKKVQQRRDSGEYVGAILSASEFFD